MARHFSSFAESLATPDKAFEVVTDFADADWLAPIVTNPRHVSGPQSGLGACYQVDVMGTSRQLTFTRFDPPKVAELKLNNEGINLTITFTVISTTPGSRVTIDVDLKAGFVAETLAVPMVGKYLPKAAQNLAIRLGEVAQSEAQKPGVS